MKLTLLVAAVLLLGVAISAATLRADEKAAAAAPSAGGRPTSVVPKEKDRNRHEGFLRDKEAALRNGNVDLVFVGDSITDAWRGGEQNRIYKERWGKLNPLNLGISGDKTEHVLWRLEHGEVDGLRPKLVVVMIGTNNLGNNPKSTPEETAQGVKAVVAALREKLPAAKVLLLGVFPRGAQAADPYRAQIKAVNDSIAKLDDGGRTIRYLDIGDKFLDEQGTLPKEIMPDALHPNAKGYAIWADAIGPVVDEMTK